VKGRHSCATVGEALQVANDLKRNNCLMLAMFMVISEPSTLFLEQKAVL